MVWGLCLCLRLWCKSFERRGKEGCEEEIFGWKMECVCEREERKSVCAVVCIFMCVALIIDLI